MNERARSDPTDTQPASPPGWPGQGPRRRAPEGALLAMVLIIATAGLVYELVMAAVASYVLGDSVRQFSLIIGIYLSALGLGAYLSRFIDRELARTFVDVELAAAVVGGSSAPALFLAASYTSSFQLFLYATVVVVGVLVGLELPLLIRLLERQLAFKELIAKALTFDYAGALVGSLAFSLLLVPKLGLVHTSVACGLLNALVGLVSTWLLPVDDEQQRRRLRAARVRAIVVTLLMVALIFGAGPLARFAERALYADPVVHAEQSRYQRIVLTEHAGNLQLFLNGNLQFSSRDEHRYHESLVHPGMAAAQKRERVLIGGGGDGLAVREVLEWPDVKSVTLVDLDERVTRLARTHQRLSQLNRGVLDDERVQVEHDDAIVWFRRGNQRFDVIILDFPDPSNYSLGKLYSARFYRSVRARLAPGGALVVQSTSPLFARRSFWCIVRTLESVGFSVRPYHAFVPSFGEWGYVLAKHEPFDEPGELAVDGQRYLTPGVLRSAFAFPPDMARVAAEPNLLNNQALVGYYIEEWSRWQ